MSDEPIAGAEKPPVLIPADPDDVPVRTVNNVASIIIGSVVGMTFITDRVGFNEDGSQRPEPVIAARLRFDLELARMIRDQLNVQIDLLTKPEGKAN